MAHKSTAEYLNLAAARTAEGAAMALAASNYDDRDDLTPEQRAQVQAIESALWDARRDLLNLARTLTEPAVRRMIDNW